MHSGGVTNIAERFCAALLPIKLQSSKRDWAAKTCQGLKNSSETIAPHAELLLVRLPRRHDRTESAPPGNPALLEIIFAV
jgi:hypothetical protein